MYGWKCYQMIPIDTNRITAPHAALQKTVLPLLSLTVWSTLIFFRQHYGPVGKLLNYTGNHMTKMITAFIATMFAGAAFAQAPATTAPNTATTPAITAPATKAEVKADAKAEKAEAKAEKKAEKADTKAEKKAEKAEIKVDKKAEKADAKAAADTAKK